MKKIIIIGTSIIGVFIFVLTLYFGINSYIQEQKYKVMLKNNYEKAFTEATLYVGNTNNLLTKINIVQDPASNAEILSEIWKQSQNANTNFSSLPYNQEIVINTMKFLSQTSDLSYSLLVKSLDNKELTDDDMKNVSSLTNYSNMLTSELNNIVLAQNISGGIDWEKIADETSEPDNKGNGNVSKEALLGDISSINKNFSDYPSLIYDGPFSDHVKDIKPKLLKNGKTLTSDEAKEKAKTILKPIGDFQIDLINESPKNLKNNIAVYSFAAKTNPKSKDYDLFIDITKVGGYPLWILKDDIMETGANTIDANGAIDKATKFLTYNGFSKMKYSYYEIYENAITINFASLKDNVTCYSDLVKVKVSLSTGNIMGLESLGYINMHYDRTLKTPTLTKDQAVQYLSPEFTISSESLTLIPLPNKTEVLCYEFKGNYKGNTFLIYINANSGKTENILQLLISDNGVLAV